MITTFKIMIVIALAAAVVMGCSEDDDPSAEEEYLRELAGTWSLAGGSVKLNDADVAGAFTELEILFDRDRRYETSAAVDPIWPASGTFKLVKNNLGLYDLLRNDGMIIEVTALAEHSLSFHLHYASPQSRSESIDGTYYFVLTR